MKHPTPYMRSPVIDEIKRNTPSNILLLLRQVFDKYGTCFPNLDHDEWIEGINIRDNWCNTVGLSLRYAFEMYGKKKLPWRVQPWEPEYQKYLNPQFVADKLCQLNHI